MPLMYADCHTMRSSASGKGARYGRASSGICSHHHSPKEDAATARLVSDLEAAGADVWVDYQGVASGSFVQKINEGLSGRQWLVLLMTNVALSVTLGTG